MSALPGGLCAPSSAISSAMLKASTSAPDSMRATAACRQTAQPPQQVPKQGLTSLVTVCGASVVTLDGLLNASMLCIAL